MNSGAGDGKKSGNGAPPKPPAYIVLDTNVLLRLLILDFGTREAIGIPALSVTAGSKIVLAPCQEDEFWRNASEVLSEHTKRWTQIARDTRKGIGDLIVNLKASQALGILEVAQEQVLKDLNAAKKHLEGIREREIKWRDFEVFAEKNFAVMRKMTEGAAYDPDVILERAERRVAMSNPPCRDKKTRPLGDCMVWEVVISLLERKHGVCWFATTDSDFSDQDDIHSLNRLLEREVRRSGGEFNFIHEDRALGLSPGSRFKVLAQLAETIPGAVTEQMRRDLEALGTISPAATWLQVEDALRRLPARERDILRLRLGLGDGFDYTQAEVARIFKLSQSRISQIQRSAADKLRELLGEDDRE